MVTIVKDRSKKVFRAEYSLYVKTDRFDPLFVAKIKAFPLRFYDPETKSWEVPLASLDLLRANFTDAVFKNLDDELYKSVTKEESVEEYEERLRDIKPRASFDFKTEPRPWQIEFFNLLLDADQFILSDPQGMGKTKEAIDVAEYRRQNFGYLKIILACKDKHKGNMAKEIKKHGRSDYIIIRGTRSQRMRQIERFFDDPNLYYMIMGYETGKTLKHHIIECGSGIGVDGILLDEYTKITNPRAQLTRDWMSLISVFNPELLLFMSGTPITKRPSQAWVPLTLMKREKRTYHRFIDFFAIKDTWGRPVGWKNLDTLHDMMSDIMVRRPKGLLKLYPKTIIDYPVEMGLEQQVLYNAVRLNIKQELEDTKISAGVSSLAKLTRLRQVTTNPALIESDAPSAKHEALLDLLEEIIDDNEEYVIVTSIYKGETRILRKLLAKYNPCYVDGDVGDLKAQEQVDIFQEDPSCKVFIGTLDSIKESYTLTKARYVIFVDLSWVYTDNEQLEDRAWRLGQDGTVTIYRLICEDTIDQKVLDILDRDLAVISTIVEGRPIKQYRQRFIQRLVEAELG